MKKDSNSVKLNPVKKSDLQFLYDLLKERDPRANISHRKMPTFSQHEKFVNSKPYSKWYIITDSGEKVGSIYLTKQNEIGIFVKKDVQSKGIGMKAIIEMMEKNPRSRYLANVNPKNRKSIEFFKKNGFKLLQYTFELEKS